MFTDTSLSIEKMPDLAKVFIEKLKSSGSRAEIVGLSGELGAGKTTFVQFVAKELGIKENVTSPTFVIMKIFEISREDFPFQKLVHIDAYRLEDHKELIALGWEEVSSDPKNLILIEWPEKVEEALPGNIKKISFTVSGEEQRNISIQW